MKNAVLLSLLAGAVIVSGAEQAAPASRPLYRARGEERVRLANGESKMVELKVSDGR